MQHNNNNNNNRVEAHGDAVENFGDPAENFGDPAEIFDDAFGGLEQLAQCSLMQYALEREQHADHFEQSWAHLAHSGREGVDDLNPACIAMLDSLESRERFLREWDVNRQRLLNSMQNCPAFQGIIDHPQG